MSKNKKYAKIMVKQEEQDDEISRLRKASEPLIKYLNDNYHPHVTAVVTPTSVELFESMMCVSKIYDFMRD